MGRRRGRRHFASAKLGRARPLRYIDEKAAQAQGRRDRRFGPEGRGLSRAVQSGERPPHGPVRAAPPERPGPGELPSQLLEDGETLLVEAPLPSLGLAPVKLKSGTPLVPEPVAQPAAIETAFYSARIDPATGALASLRQKPSGRELLGGLANVVLVEVRTNSPAADPHNVPERNGRRTVGSSSDAQATLQATTGPLATVVVAQSPFHGGGFLRR